MKDILFLTALVLEGFYYVMFILTLRRPGFRFWPPPGPRSWQFFAAWIVASLVAVCFLFLGALDFDSFVLHTWLRIPVAIGLLLLTSLFGTWAFATFGLRAVIGLGDRLITHGPYQYSRNPQYLGDSLSILAFMLLTNAWMVWGVGLLGIGLNLLAPLVEEPWLEERFGAAYLDYKRRVPRFLGPRPPEDAA